MKKLLGATLALLMGASCAIGFTACGGDDDDADKAKEAIGMITSQYGGDAAETAFDYDVFGQVKVGEDMVTVNWTVSSTVSNLDDYVTVGAMNETTKLVTISIGATDTVIEYTLKASVTVGKATESTEFSRKVPVSEKVYSVAEVKTLGASLAKGSYYEVDGTATQILVKGYVVDPGSWSTQYNNFTGVYIVDQYSADKTKDSDDAFQVYRIGKDDKFISQESDLAKGDLITVKGFVQNYNGKLQVTYNGKETPTVVAMKKAERSDADKVAAAKNAVKLDTVRFLKVKEVDLPTESNDATLTWAVKGTTDLVTVTNNKLNIVKLPETVGTVKVTLTVTIKSGSVTDTKDIEINVINAGTPALTNDGTKAKPFTAAEVKAIAATLEDNDFYRGGEVDPQMYYIQGYVVDKGTFNTSFNNFNNVYIADTATGTKADGIMIYRIVTDSTYLKKDGDLAVGDLITVCGFIQNYKGDTPEVTYNGNDNVTCEALEKGETPVTPPSVDGAVSVVIANYASANGWENGKQYTTLNIDANITVTVSGTNSNPQYSANTGKYYTNGSDWRIYQTENPSITFTATEGNKIVSIKITYNAEKTGALTNADKTTQYVSDAVIEVNAGTITFSVGNSGDATNGQVRITAIEVVYEAV